MRESFASLMMSRHDAQEHLFEIGFLQRQLGYDGAGLAQSGQQLLELGVALEREQIRAVLLAYDTRVPCLGQQVGGEPYGKPGEARQQIALRVERDDFAGLEHRDPPAQRLGFLEV